MWAKVQSIWAFIYDNFYNDYDWFHLGGMYSIGLSFAFVESPRAYLFFPQLGTNAHLKYVGDDMWMIVENMRLYLESEEIVTAANGGKYLPNGDEKTQTPLYLGSTFAYRGKPDRLYQTGGPGKFNFGA